MPNTKSAERRVRSNERKHQRNNSVKSGLRNAEKKVREAIAAGKKEEAADQLLDSIRRDRKWNEEAARKQLVQLFEAWGPKDEATLDGRRRLSSILFS